MPATHISPFSGGWYPEDPGELECLLEERFAASLRRTGPFLFPRALGYIVPHAGPAWSGTVAAGVYRSLRQQKPERIVVLAFPHRGGIEGLVSPDIDRISTPLGEVALDTAFAGGFPRVAEERVCDHSFEIQLPFLQKAAPEALVTPLYAGRMEAGERRAAAERLAAAWRPGTVFLASSDFTHYGRSFGYLPFPTDGAVAARLDELDHDCLDAAGSLDSALFLDTVAARNATVCGTSPIALLLDVLRRLDGSAGIDSIYQSVLDYQTSGEITGGYRHSVSYAAVGYFPRSAFDLEAADCDALLDAAAETLERLRQTGERRAAVAAGSPALSARRGAFVSLHQGEELLGCVGNCAGRKPLGEEIGGLTLAAALEDPRFRPAAGVRGPIAIELSVLTPFRRIRDMAQFRVGRHGAMLRLGGHSGLLLPQVAEHREWTAEDFFRALARKSLLGPHAWSDPQARLEIFEAQVWDRRPPS
jgi:AmmeMemoRadiSam system protein B/AmmeMemoRadiSam system protein A